LTHAREVYHVNSERVYFVGVGEGAAVALRLALTIAEDVAGLVILNGKMPTIARRSLSRLRSNPGLPIFIGHGTNNPVTPYSTARKTSRMLSSVGADVQLASYATTHRVHPDMLRDVNRWIMGAVTTEPESNPLETLG
jgi:phospholipase/carboxylesterase